MNSGSYSPVFRMMAGQTDRLETVTENLANCTMPGYRRLQVDHKVFDTLLKDAMQQPGGWQDARAYDPITVDFTPGPMRNTSRPLDFAINGNDAFFVVEKDGKELYTRNGHFSTDAQGNLKDANGFPVLGPNGPVIIPPGTDLATLEVDHLGNLRSKGAQIDTIRLASFSVLERLQRAGTTLFSAPNDMPPQEPAPETRIINSTLEASNTTVFNEMAETISCMRAYEACQRMVRNQDENEGRMIQQMGM